MKPGDGVHDAHGIPQGDLKRLPQDGPFLHLQRGASMQGTTVGTRKRQQLLALKSRRVNSSNIRGFCKLQNVL